jgi:hypothetical protein
LSEKQHDVDSTPISGLGETLKPLNFTQAESGQLVQPLSILCRSFQDVDKYTMGFPRGNSQGQTNVFRAARQCLPGPVSAVEPFLCGKIFFACGVVRCYSNHFVSCTMYLIWLLCA